MSRDIEYRVWDKRRKLMFELEAPTLDTEYGGIFLASKSLSHTNSLRDARDEDLVLLEFTGLKDKHGTKIFEGDVARQGETGVVTYRKEYCQFCILHTFDKTQMWIPLTELSSLPDHSACEVIGNIYEHSYLLKEAA